MFFQVDDQFQVNAKAMALANRALTGDLDGLAAIGLWTLAGSLCQAQLTDGVVSLADIVRTTLNPVEGPRLAGILVEAGLWHAPGHSCPRCPDVAEGTWLFHDWFQFKYDSADQARLKRDKRKELSNKRIRNAVWRRDRVGPPAEGRSEEADCRYCGRRLLRADRKGEGRAEIDHVDPSLVIGVDNLVVCCQECNTKKGDRSLEDAGMRLRPAPVSSSQDVGGPMGSAAAVGGEPGAGVHSASGVPSCEGEPVRPAGCAGADSPSVQTHVLREGMHSGSPAAAVAGPVVPSLAPWACGTETGRGGGVPSLSGGSGDGSKARDSDPSPGPHRGRAPVFPHDDAGVSTLPACWTTVVGRPVDPDQGKNQNAHPVPARTRAGGVGQGEERKGEAGPGAGRAGPGLGQGRAGQGSAPRRRRKRKRRRSRGGSSAVVCPEHGDTMPCRLCAYEARCEEV